MKELRDMLEMAIRCVMKLTLLATLVAARAQTPADNVEMRSHSARKEALFHSEIMNEMATMSPRCVNSPCLSGVLQSSLLHFSEIGTTTERADSSPDAAISAKSADPFTLAKVDSTTSTIKIRERSVFLYPRMRMLFPLSASSSFYPVAFYCVLENTAPSAAVVRLDARLEVRPVSAKHECWRRSSRWYRPLSARVNPPEDLKVARAYDARSKELFEEDWSNMRDANIEAAAVVPLGGGEILPVIFYSQVVPLRWHLTLTGSDVNLVVAEGEYRGSVSEYPVREESFMHPVIEIREVITIPHSDRTFFSFDGLSDVIQIVEELGSTGSGDTQSAPVSRWTFGDWRRRWSVRTGGVPPSLAGTESPRLPQFHVAYVRCPQISGQRRVFGWVDGVALVPMRCTVDVPDEWVPSNPECDLVLPILIRDGTPLEYDGTDCYTSVLSAPGRPGAQTGGHQ